MNILGQHIFANFFSGDTSSVEIPNISFREIESPHELLETFRFKKTSPSELSLPVLIGEESDAVEFRIYNNYEETAGMLDATQCQLVVYDNQDGDASNPPAAQQWIVAEQLAYGNTGKETYYRTDKLAIGGTTKFSLLGSNGIIGFLGANQGFIDIKLYLEIPTNVSLEGEHAFLIGLEYEYAG